MSAAIEVSDSLSNTEEQIERAAKTIGRSKSRRLVFETIYYHKKRVKSVDEIVEKTSLSRVRVLQEGGKLARSGVVRQVGSSGKTAYEKIDFFHVHKGQILRLAGNPKKLEKLPTKRKLVTPNYKLVSIPGIGAQVDRITIDDVGEFSAVRNVKPGVSISSSISEGTFKNGIQRIVGEPGVFKDWGGEKSDLFSTRFRVAGKRRAVAFAFKGPGQRGRLVPSRMGKNGDQALRLFQEPAEVFLVQHWRDIDSSVIELLRSLAVAKSVLTKSKIWYGIIDGVDSQRIWEAYRASFKSSRR